jgi:glycine/D-amino acid oxidase-like deaminating enzyme
MHGPRSEKAICTECANDADEQRFTQAYAAALERMGHLLVALAAPVQEAIDEVDELRTGRGGGVTSP